MAKGNMKKILVGFFVGVCVGGASVYGYVRLSAPSATLSPLLVFTAQTVSGKADAPVKVIEYASVGCHACSHFKKDTWPQIKKIYVDSGRVHWTARPYPLGGLDLKAAMLAYCSQTPDPLLEEFYTKQERWMTSKDPLAEIKKIAMEKGMTDAEIEACWKKEDLLNELIHMRMQASEVYGVQATPAFVVGGTMVPGAAPYETFVVVLDKAEQHVAQGKPLKDFAMTGTDQVMVHPLHQPPLPPQIEATPPQAQHNPDAVAPSTPKAPHGPAAPAPQKP